MTDPFDTKAAAARMREMQREMDACPFKDAEPFNAELFVAEVCGE
ncbi:MAG TPA: hypothetical protein PLO06_11450 [Methanoregulaceae archaeon]|nr:hypothetical protein [Methanoregulaceae archaeon]